MAAYSFRSSGSQPLFEIIRKQVGHRTLGSNALRTGLAIVAKRIDTGSPWVFHNNPRSRYFHPPEDAPEAVANCDLELAEILRASTAAPTYFKPETITIARGVEGLFVDGGVSPFNNPALLLLLMATSQAYGYGWRTGGGNLTLVSIGTGTHTPTRKVSSFLRLPSSLQAISALESIMADTAWHAQAVLQWLGTSSNPWTIDAEAGDLNTESPASEPLFHYERFDLLLDADWMKSELGKRLSAKELRMYAAMDRPETAERLLAIARDAAKSQVTPEALK